MEGTRAPDASSKVSDHRLWLVLVAFLLIGAAQFILWRLALPADAYYGFRVAPVLWEPGVSEWIADRQVANAVSLGSPRLPLLALAELPVLTGILVVVSLWPLLRRARKLTRGERCFYFGGFLAISLLWLLPTACPRLLTWLTDPASLDWEGGVRAPVGVALAELANTELEIWTDGALLLAFLAWIVLLTQVYRLTRSDASAEGAM